MIDLDAALPRLNELDLAEILQHFRDCGADHKAIDRISKHIARICADSDTELTVLRKEVLRLNAVAEEVHQANRKAFTERRGDDRG